jgi:hypothetical protein
VSQNPNNDQKNSPESNSEDEAPFAIERFYAILRFLQEIEDDVYVPEDDSWVDELCAAIEGRSGVVRW